MRRFTQRHEILLAILVAAIVYGFWITLPPTQLALNPSCAVDDPVFQISEILYGTKFWRKQAAAIDATIQSVQLLQADAERTRNQPPPEPQINDKSTPYEQRMRRLSTEAETKSQEENLRQWHDEIDWLARCDTVVVARLKPRPAP
jgi:hypothetical protein